VGPFLGPYSINTTKKARKTRQPKDIVCYFWERYIENNMQPIKFECNIIDGIIKIPEHYQPWFKKSVQVILLENKPSEKVSSNPQLPKGVGCYHSGRQDISTRAEELLFQPQTREAKK